METELRLGMPGNAEAAKGNGSKRGFHEALDLKLNFSSMAPGDEGGEKLEKKNHVVSLPSVDPAKPPSKEQVVGWPPVRSFKKNMAVQKKGGWGVGGGENGGNTALFVKVSMDGAPYLRKVDLRVYKSYEELSFALSKMFSSFVCDYDYVSDWSLGTEDFANKRKLVHLLHNSEYVPTYEDKDGDWMLVGDVPYKC